MSTSPSLGCSKPAIMPQRRSLSASGGAEKRQEFACTDPKVDAIGGDDLTEPLGDATELDNCRFGRQGRRSCF
jgi:hypothetical protein